MLKGIISSCYKFVNKGVPDMLKVQEIRELIKLVDQSAIDEFTYETDGTTVSMKKSGNNSAAAVNTDTAAIPEQPAEPVKIAAPEIQTEQPARGKAAHGDKENVAPIVGTCDAKPTPESDTYVKKGSTVEADTVV